MKKKDYNQFRTVARNLSCNRGRYYITLSRYVKRIHASCDTDAVALASPIISAIQNERLRNRLLSFRAKQDVAFAKLELRLKKQYNLL